MAQEFAADHRALGDEGIYCLTPERIRRDGFGAAPAFAGIVAEQGGALVGYLLHHPGYDTDRAERYVVICHLFVRDAWRRQGVGRALMSAAAAHCRSLGGAGLFWSVVKPNKTALAFYRGLGAATVETLDFMWWPAA